MRRNIAMCWGMMDVRAGQGGGEVKGREGQRVGGDLYVTRKSTGDRGSSCNRGHNLGGALGNQEQIKARYSSIEKWRSQFQTQLEPDL